MEKEKKPTVKNKPPFPLKKSLFPQEVAWVMFCRGLTALVPEAGQQGSMYAAPVQGPTPQAQGPGLAHLFSNLSITFHSCQGPDKE